MADEQQPADAGRGSSEEKPVPIEGGDQNGKGAGDGAAKPGDDTNKAPDKKEEAPATEVKDEEPIVRKSKLDYILERKQAKADKLKQEKLKELDKQIKTEAGEEDDEVSPDDEKVVEKVIEKKYGDYFREMDEEKEAAEINGFIAQNPEFKPYETKIRKFASHPSRRHIPISSIAYEVAGPDLMRLGAERAKKADEKAKEASLKAGGSEKGEEGSGVLAGIEKMSPTSKEFAELVEKAKTGRL